MIEITTYEISAETASARQFRMKGWLRWPPVGLLAYAEGHRTLEPDAANGQRRYPAGHALKLNVASEPGGRP